MKSNLFHFLSKKNVWESATTAVFSSNSDSDDDVSVSKHIFGDNHEEGNSLYGY